MENLRIKMRDPSQEKKRFADAVIRQIWQVIQSECQDPILLNKWKNDFMWFDQFRFDVYAFKYYHWSPEKIEETKWEKLAQILNECIPPFQTPSHTWEKIIVDMFLGTFQDPHHVCIDIPE